MCDCDGTGYIEIHTFGVGLREVQCPDDNCTYWTGE